MKIVFFVHCFFPDHFYGTETYTRHLAKEYQARGLDVTVVCGIFPGEKPAADLITSYVYDGIKVIAIDKNRLPNRYVRDTYYQVEMRPVLEKILRSLKPDLVHVTHLINHSAVLLEVLAEKDIPVYATFTDFFGFCFNNKLEASDHSLCSGPSIFRSNCMACYIQAAAENDPGLDTTLKKAAIAPNLVGAARVLNIKRHFSPLKGSMADRTLGDLYDRPGQLRKLYGTYKAAAIPTKFMMKAYRKNDVKTKLHNIWFGVDINRAPKPERSIGHRPVIGFIGQLTAHKGTDILIEAFRRLPRQAAHLDIYGPLDQDPTYIAQLRGLVKGSAVRFRGTFPQINTADILASIDVLVMPSRWYENSPLVLLNALATHTPVIVSDVEGLTEFIEEGKSGFSFQRASVDDLERVLRNVLADHERLYGFGRLTNFERTNAVMARETMKMYGH